MKFNCANPGCLKRAHSFTIKLKLPGSGLKKENQWFCGRRCYRNFIADQLIIDKRHGLKKTIRRVKLGLLLVKNNLIDNDQLTAALEEKSGSLKKIGEILVDSGKITTKELKAALSMQAGVAPINLDSTAKIKIKEEIPFKVIDEFHFVLFDCDHQDRVISVAVYNMDYISSLQEYFGKLFPGYLAKFYLEDRKKVLGIIANNYPDEKLNDQVEDQLTPPDNGFGADLEKTVLRIEDFLNRLSGNPVKIDSLDNAVWLKGETKKLKVDIYLTKKIEESNKVESNE
ncbi:MAG: hypothetical protein GY940_28165 [bacterium]|nr:hypothetical protein [bacterium]